MDFFDDSSGAYDSWFLGLRRWQPIALPEPISCLCSAGNYTVSLTVSNCCCSHTETKSDYITVRPRPEADFHTSDTTICANVAVNFTDDSTGVLDAWYWDFAMVATAQTRTRPHLCQRRQLHCDPGCEQ